MPGRQGGHSLDKARELFARRDDPCALCRGALGPINYRGGMVRNPKTGRLCRDPLSLDVDHIVPTKYGGTDELSNLQATHRICNQKAGAKDKGKSSVQGTKKKKRDTPLRANTRTSRKW